ncbi:hypothetical protein [Paraclostridium dentum]|uniref:hypothetical protein n=1 Tax=Paraclostridium dentum TaxID=2662455 RepID=UPI00346482CE
MNTMMDNFLIFFFVVLFVATISLVFGLIVSAIQYVLIAYGIVPIIADVISYLIMALLISAFIWFIIKKQN